MRQLLNSLQHAATGIVWALKEHRNFRIHLLLALAAISVALFFNFSLLELAILFLIILFVLFAEMVNTAIEEVTNLITVKWAKEAKVAKDVGAGAVLISAIGALIIGLLLLMSKL